jgi:YebC/PmpR family DNA-binding regulatory protein
MAGHSKWANIRFKKNARDAKRGKLFTKLIREITVAARLGGEDPNSNNRLRTAIDKALIANMVKDTIERAIKRGAGGLEGGDLLEILYEGYGPSGVAILVYTMTDNRNRTVGEVRHAFTKCGGNLGTEGSVNYLFQKRGEILFVPPCDENKIIELALKLEAIDVITETDGSIEVITAPDLLNSTKQHFEAAGLVPENAEVVMHAATKVDLDRESSMQLMKLTDMLEELDDVQNVYNNAHIPDEVWQSLTEN